VPCRSTEKGTASTLLAQGDKSVAIVESLRKDMKHDLDALNARAKVDLNVEAMRLRDELRKAQDLWSRQEARLELDIGRVRTSIEASKNEMIRYTLATIFSLTAVAFGAMRVISIKS
jgi:uncharacterized protein HemX